MKSGPTWREGEGQWYVVGYEASHILLNSLFLIVRGLSKRIFGLGESQVWQEDVVTTCQ